MYLYKLIVLPILLLTLLVFLPARASAGEVNIINNVSSSASTGGLSAQAGNSAGAGETIEGKASADISIYTEINGEVIEDIKESIAGDGARVIEEVREVQTDDSRARVETRVEINVGTGAATGTETDTEIKTGSSTVPNIDSSILTDEIVAETKAKDTTPPLIERFIKQLFTYVFGFFHF